MREKRFIVLDTHVVDGTIYVYGWLDGWESTSPDPMWYELEAMGLKDPAKKVRVA